jgi:hypothetical protein
VVSGRTPAGLTGSGGGPVAVRLALDFPGYPLHPRSAVDSLLRVLPSAVELPGCPEPPQPDFAAHLESFVAAVAGFSRA